MNNRILTVRDMCLIGVFAAMITAVSQISIPMPYGVPMTLQTLIIPLAGIIIGARNGTLATLMYVLLGAIGLPVFAGFTGGIGAVLGPTGGFIISFPFVAYAAGLGSRSGSKLHLTMGLIIGALVNYGVGVLLFCILLDSSVSTALAACVLPFIPTAIIKMVIAGFIGTKVRDILEHRRINCDKSA